MKNDTRVTTQMAEITIGLDVGDRLSHYCKLDVRGEVVERGEVKSEQGALTELFKEMPRSRGGARGGDALALDKPAPAALARSGGGERAQRASADEREAEERPDGRRAARKAGPQKVEA